MLRWSVLLIATWSLAPAQAETACWRCGTGQDTLLVHSGRDTGEETGKDTLRGPPGRGTGLPELHTGDTGLLIDPAETALDRGDETGELDWDSAWEDTEDTGSFDPTGLDDTDEVLLDSELPDTAAEDTDTPEHSDAADTESDTDLPDPSEPETDPPPVDSDPPLGETDPVDSDPPPAETDEPPPPPSGDTDPIDPIDDKPDGCSCASAPDGPLIWGLPPWIGLVMLRRRRASS